MASNRPTLNPKNKPAFSIKSNKIRQSEIVASQPGKTTWAFKNDWTFRFCEPGCGSHDCSYACFCLPCYIGNFMFQHILIFEGMQNLFLYYLAHLATMTKETSCIVCCVPLTLMHLRTKIRTLLRIDVNFRINIF
jgi:hypothetical protein